MNILLLLLVKALLLLLADFELIQHLFTFFQEFLYKRKLEGAIQDTFHKVGKGDFKGAVLLSYTYEIVLHFLHG